MGRMTFPSPKARREARMKAERLKLANEENPTLPRPCECDRPIRDFEDDGAPFCFKCSKGLAA